MQKNRLEAFSDGVLAIIITIMILEMKMPHGSDWAALKPTIPIFLSYLISFVYIAIYWNNHHHMLHTVSRVSGGILWANMHLLFWLSLVPFATGWLGENHFGQVQAALYGIVLLMAGVAYFILQQTIIKHQGPNSKLKHAIGNDLKGKSSPILYSMAILASAFNQWISMGIYTFVALMWLVPDRRIERMLAHEE